MSQKKSSLTLPLLFMVLVFLAATWGGQWFARPNVQLPAPLPDVQVEGWLHTTGPITDEDLAGKWVVVDCWATWCGPCIAAMPLLAELHEDWQARDIVLLGVTSDDRSAMPQMNELTDTIEGFTWPVAYGGGQLFRKLNVEAIPTLVLYNPQGELVWQGHSIADFETKLPAANK